jgi:competence protein ComEA
MNLTRRDWMAVGFAVAGSTAVLAGAAFATASVLSGPSAGASPLSSGMIATASSSAGAVSAAAVDVLVDVQGAVKHPGVVLLPPVSRVADALQAAGGYAANADLNAAATSLNLAAQLTDGAQVFVPIIGVAAQPGGGGGGSAGAGGSGLVNLNTATPEELEALPGIGPVTVQKIVAARAEQPFATLDEMVERGVLDRGQVEDVRDLVTF